MRTAKALTEPSLVAYVISTISHELARFSSPHPETTENLYKMLQSHINVCFLIDYIYETGSQLMAQLSQVMRKPGLSDL